MSEPVFDRRLEIKEHVDLFILVVTWLSLPYQIKHGLFMLKFIPEQLNASIYHAIKFAKILTAH